MVKQRFILSSIFVTLSTLISTPSQAELHLSDLPASEGKGKTHRILEEPDPTDVSKLGGFNELLPYVMASPDQEDAGSCLYMAITGIAEWWLARLNPTASRAADGPLDLSERYIMNVAGMEEGDAPLANWRTDSIYLFNQNQNQSLLNSTYRFTKGWFLGDSYSDHLTAAKSTTPGAEYGTLFNWIDQRPAQPTGVVKLPNFERDVLFADAEGNQWNVGVAPSDIVQKVKDTLRKKKAPVLVVYNQNSYWHAVYVIGFNDQIDNGNCAYTERFRVNILERAKDLSKKAEEATDPKVKDAYEIRAKRAFEAKDKIEKAYAAQGGCSSSHGVFYIRDSIYPDESGPYYDYDPSQPGAKAHYAKKIVFKEYDWLKLFANHISVIYPKP